MTTVTTTNRPITNQSNNSQQTNATSTNNSKNNTSQYQNNTDTFEPASPNKYSHLTGNSSAQNNEAAEGPSGAKKASPADQADKDYQNMGRNITTDEVMKLLNSNTDPAYRAQIIARLKRDEKLPDLLTGGNGLFSRTGMYNDDYQNFSDQERQTFIDSIKAAMDAGKFSADEIRFMAHESTTGMRGGDPAKNALDTAWQDLAERLNISGVGEKAVCSPAVLRAEKLKREMDATSKKLDELDKRLNDELTRLGPALTPEERQKFIDAFRKENSADYDAAYKAAAALAEELRGPSKDILDKAAGESSAFAKDLYDCYKQVAKCPATANYALDFILDFKEKYGSSASDVFSKRYKDFDVVNDLIVPGSASEAIGNEDVDKFFSRLKDVSSVLKDGSNADTQKFIEKLRQATLKTKDGDYSALKDLANEADGVPKYCRAFAAAALVAAAKNATDETRKGELISMVDAWSNTASNFCDVVQPFFKAWGDAGKIGCVNLGPTTSSILKNFANAFQKLGPVLGAVSSAAAVLGDIEDLTDKFGAGIATKFAGDVVALIGAVMAIGASTAGVGTALMVLGGIAAFAGDLIMSEEERQKAINDTVADLKRAGISGSDEALRNLANGKAETIQKLSEAGLSASQIRQLLAAEYELGQVDVEAMDAFINMAKKGDLSSDEIFRMLEAVAKCNDNVNGKASGLICECYYDYIKDGYYNNNKGIDFREYLKSKTNNCSNRSHPYNFQVAYDALYGPDGTNKADTGQDNIAA